MRSRFPILTFFIVVILFIAAVGIIPAAGAAQTHDTRDGNWWTTQTLAFKVPYVLGMFDAIDLGYSWSSSGFSNPVERVCFESTAKTFVEQRRRYLVGVTAGQVVDGLDDFYKDYRNRAIAAGTALELVLRSIAGEDISDLTVTYRRVPRGQ